MIKVEGFKYTLKEGSRGPRGPWNKAPTPYGPQTEGRLAKKIKGPGVKVLKVPYTEDTIAQTRQLQLVTCSCTGSNVNVIVGFPASYQHNGCVCMLEPRRKPTGKPELVPIKGKKVCSPNPKR